MPAKKTAKQAAKKTASVGAKRANHGGGKAKPVAGTAVAADLVDEQLAKYRGMRDFDVTAEPAGKDEGGGGGGVGARSEGLPFVIQKHAASHLHYDFRLGWAGVLKSWAVAKGPSYVVADKRLAVQVEDHPLEYGGFEGTIPKGQYGGGTVMVWDQGTWWPQPGHEDVEAGLREGSLKFELQGAKLQGKWTLIRMKARADEGGRWKASDKPQWLLIKEHDALERPAGAPAIVDQAPDSALTGRSMEQIAQASDHVWNSKDTAGPSGTAWQRQEAPAEATTLDAKLLDKLYELPAEPQPEFLQPQLAQETSAPPDGAGWLHELKLDGYRVQARKSAGGAVQLLTRSGLDWTYRMPEVADAVARLGAGAVTLDGEVVVLAADGTTSFAALQASFQHGGQHPLTYFAFDLLHLDGRNPRNLALRERKALLARLIPPHVGEEGNPTLRLSEHLEASGQAVFEQACKMHAEGIVSKRADAPYEIGRRASWLKSKCLHEQEFVIGGYGPSIDGPDRIGSLLLGYYRDGKLIYAGRTGTGFTQRQRQELRAQLAGVETKTTPFAKLPAEARRDRPVWVKPVLVAQVRFATWTADELVRQAAFLGLREDKAPGDVVRENAATPPRPKTGPRATSPSKTSVDKNVAAKTLAAPVRLTHPRKVLDPESQLSKQQLADYYWAVAARMLPHIADRPLSLVRCPEGAGKPCFYQKHINSMLPPGIGSVMVADKKGGPPEPYLTLNTAEALAALAQIGVLEVHPWSSRNAELECPDRLIFDLDPDEALAWSTVVEAAFEIRERLKSAGLESFVKTTGGKGLHIVAPVLPQQEFATVKEVAHRFILAMERANPRLYLSKMTKAARVGKIYLDYLRNERGATAVAPYSPRARAGIPVSVPLEWKELAAPERPRFAVADFAAWADRLRRDPWKRMATLRQALNPARIRGL